MALTWRLERPEATTMVSATVDLPARSTATTCSALAVSRLFSTLSTRADHTGSATGFFRAATFGDLAAFEALANFRSAVLVMVFLATALTGFCFGATDLAGSFPETAFLTTGFLVIGFLTTGFLAIGFFAGALVAANFFAAGFLTIAFLAIVFLATGFLATGFFASVFLTADFLAGAFFDGAFLTGAFLTGAFLTGAFFTGGILLTDFFAAGLAVFTVFAGLDFLMGFFRVVVLQWHYLNRVLGGDGLGFKFCF